MINTINISHVFVFDQEKALDFYVGKLGLEVSNDTNLGFMRWLTVRAAGDPSHDILLEVPAPPGMDEKSAEKVRELIAISEEVRSKAGVAGGDTVDVDVELDTQPREVDVPQELAKALAKDAKAKKYFESLSYSGKIRLVAPIANGKTTETRERNVAKAM